MQAPVHPRRVDRCGVCHHHRSARASRSVAECKKVEFLHDGLWITGASPGLLRGLNVGAPPRHRAGVGGAPGQRLQVCRELPDPLTPAVVGHGVDAPHRARCRDRSVRLDVDADVACVLGELDLDRSTVVDPGIVIGGAGRPELKA